MNENEEKKNPIVNFVMLIVGFIVGLAALLAAGKQIWEMIKESSLVPLPPIAITLNSNQPVTMEPELRQEHELLKNEPVKLQYKRYTDTFIVTPRDTNTPEARKAISVWGDKKLRILLTFTINKERKTFHVVPTVLKWRNPPQDTEWDWVTMPSRPEGDQDTLFFSDWDGSDRGISYEDFIRHFAK